MTIDVRPVATAADLRAFVRFPHRLYHGDPHWVAPLPGEAERRVDRQRNPFFAHADRELFLARRDGAVVGRIAAIVNHAHNQQLGRQIGTFGFFETVDEPAVAEALIGAATAWLRRFHVERLRGPYNGAPTDEAGLFVDGVERTPALWEAYNLPYYPKLLEALGFHKYDDLLAYQLSAADLQGDPRYLSPVAWRLGQRLYSRSDVRLRSLRDGDWSRDLRIVHAIYNTAFRSIPEHADMDFEAFAAQAGRLRRVLDPDLVLILEIGDQPAGFALALPDLNQALRHLRGSTTAWRRLRFEWQRRHIRVVCFKLLGVLPSFRGRGVESLLMLEIAQRSMAKGYTRCEMSLVSERNAAMRRILHRFGAKISRRYRVYERIL